MAKKQYLDLTGLQTYDEQIKAYIDGMNFISIDDIDEICGDVTEEGLPSNDIDELMAQLEEA